MVMNFSEEIYPSLHPKGEKLYLTGLPLRGTLFSYFLFPPRMSSLGNTSLGNSI